MTSRGRVWEVLRRLRLVGEPSLSRFSIDPERAFREGLRSDMDLHPVERIEGSEEVRARAEARRREERGVDSGSKVRGHFWKQGGTR